MAFDAGGLGSIPGRSNRTQCRQWLVTAAIVFRSCVAEALSHEYGPATRYTLGRNTSSIMKGNSNKKRKTSLYSRYYVEACNEWRDPSPRLSVCATQLTRCIAAMASRCFDSNLTDLRIKPKTSRTDSDVQLCMATELTGRLQ